MPYYVIRCATSSRRGWVLSLTPTSYRIATHHATSHHATACHNTSCHSMPHHIMPHHSTPYHITPQCITLHRITSYQNCNEVENNTARYIELCYQKSENDVLHSVSINPVLCKLSKALPSFQKVTRKQLQLAHFSCKLLAGDRASYSQPCLQVTFCKLGASWKKLKSWHGLQGLGWRDDRP